MDTNRWYHYPLTGYTWPGYVYGYNYVITNSLLYTNHYDNVLYTGDYQMGWLSGKTLILGNARIVATMASVCQVTTSCKLILRPPWYFLFAVLQRSVATE